MLNNITWQPLLECHHGTPVDEPPGVAVYQEVEEPRGVLLPVQVWLEESVVEGRLLPHQRMLAVWLAGPVR